MPTLDWIGKDKVINHHMDVPYRVLDAQYTFGEDTGNMIIHGDNLEALKSLLPQYEGKIRCIYIDPPYNTGNEGWVYNDNVNDPRIRKWLGQVVGSESEDLSRHDKWLCMMYPRLKLLHRLLSDDGVIFISIDDNELYNLKIICDEILGKDCFVARITWHNNFSPRNDAQGIPYTTDNILVYGKVPNWSPKRLSRSEDMDARFKSPDNDPVPWTSSPAHAPSASTHRGMVYAIQHPYTGEFFYPPIGRCWALEQSKVLDLMNEWANYELKLLDDAATRAKICGEDNPDNMPVVYAVALAESVESSREKTIERNKRGHLPKFYFTSGGKGGLRVKKHLDKMEGKVVPTMWSYDEVGTNTEAKNDLKKLFEGDVPFTTPKPTRLIERIIQIATSKDSIILDSFAGSGTTAHAVLNMNKQDGGNRKFILIEMMDYADSITAERVKRVIDGYGEGKKAVEGTGGGFTFYELGDKLLDGEYLNENVPLNKIRSYVYFTETKQAVTDKADEPHYLGTYLDTAYYFYYDKDAATTLDHDFLTTVRTTAESYVIYADRCILSNEELEKYHITFKKIPRDITRL